LPIFVRVSPHRVDARQQIYLPASLRALLDIGIGDRVLLVTKPSTDILVIYPAAVIAALVSGQFSLPTDGHLVGRYLAVCVITTLGELACCRPPHRRRTGSCAP
jgi:antidote-toxin recognition MazE-like antitoxin